MKTLLVTGGCGFIGSNYILHLRAHSPYRIVNLDKLTYAGNPANLAALSKDSRYIFKQGDVCDRALVKEIIREYSPDAVVHFAAESHVDRSIIDPDTFIQTNIVGTFTLLDEARSYRETLEPVKKETFRFHHISTDEVYGSLRSEDPPFHEKTPYAPNSPYSASKAASDHLAYSYFKTYGLPVIISNCSNNYGPYQFPEKMIPLMIINALEGKELPIYGDGMNIRDWLYVGDHVEALWAVLEKGVPGEKYNIGGCCEKANREVVGEICAILDVMNPQSPHCPHNSLIRFVKDRPGHDRRYAIDSTRISREIGWTPKKSFAEGLRETIRWYIDNREWVQSVRTGEYRDWMIKNYQQR